MMRTTITIPTSLRQKLINEAVKRNLKGYSLIISEALEEHFERDKPGADELKFLRGCMSHDEFIVTSQLLEEGRANWKM